MAHGDRKNGEKKKTPFFALVASKRERGKNVQRNSIQNRSGRCATMLTKNAARGERESKKRNTKNAFCSKNAFVTRVTHTALVCERNLVNRTKANRKNYASTRWLKCLCQHLQRRDIFFVVVVVVVVRMQHGWQQYD